MKKRPSFQKTLTYAATLAALGASIGVPVEQALGVTPAEEAGAKKGAKSSLSGSGAVQQKADRTQGMGATQAKMTRKANQYKENKAKTMGGNGGAGSNVMLNPQPLPPKQGTVGIKPSEK